MKQVNAICSLCTFLLLLVPVYVQADVYRWVDEKGQVHYGDKSPKGGEIEKVKMPTVKVRSTEAQPSELNEAERRQRQKRIIETLSTERKAREDARKKKQDEKAEKQAKCEELRIRLAESKSVNVYYRRNEQGERVFISDKERKEMDAKAEKKYQDNCSR